MFAKSLRLIVIASFVASLGCDSGNPRTAIVRGKITFQNKPVPSGTITFVPTAGHPAATGEIQPDGSYTLTTYKTGDGAVPGSHKIVIVAVHDTSNRLPEDRSPLPEPIVPNKYTSIATSDLTAEVKDEENTINFDLQE